MERVYTADAVQHIDNQIAVSGWVHARRDHGGVIFVDVRDHTGLLQVTIQPEAQAAFEVGQELRDEYVIRATGRVVEREEHLRNPNLSTGAVELIASEVELLSRSEPLPIQVNTTQTISEDNRLRYRYLDLRRPKMQAMLKQRADYYRQIRAFMEGHDFIEVATPILANSSPEGARDFLVPSRVHPGKVYALPQAPQQFKQLLMVGGVHRYYQIATCFRDEDPRADRLYGDFYQLDLEMSFVEDGETVRSTMEPLIKNLVGEFGGKQLLNDDVPRLTYQEAMDRFGTDKPDLRFGMELVDLTEETRATEFGVFKNAECVKAICVANAARLSRSQIDQFTEIAKQEGAGGLAYIMFYDKHQADENNIAVKSGTPVEGTDLIASSPIVKFLAQEELTKMVQKTKAGHQDGIFFGADKRQTVNKVLGRLRNEFADHFELKDSSVVSLVWVVDFPFYEWDEKANKLDFGHNPFSMPKGGVGALESEDKLAIVADQFDMVMNGYEVCSGAVRNHNPEVMYKVFAALGYDETYVEEKFGAMLNAFKYGAPPHAGCAFGLDRMFMVLVGEDNIREVVAFPKNGSGVDVMMNSPSRPEQQAVEELGITLPVEDA